MTHPRASEARVEASEARVELPNRACVGYVHVHPNMQASESQVVSQRPSALVASLPSSQIGVELLITPTAGLLKMALCLTPLRVVGYAN